MNILLYKTIAEKNVLNKTLESEISLDCILKQPTNILNPIIEIKTDVNLSDYNYVYIPDFKRYYYISNMTVSTPVIWTLSLNVDVLKSYASQILNSEQTVTRSAELYNLYLSDPNRLTQANNNLQIKEFPNQLEPAKSLIMVCTGSGSEEQTKQ